MVVVEQIRTAMSWQARTGWYEWNNPLYVIQEHLPYWKLNKASLLKMLPFLLSSTWLCTLSQVVYCNTTTWNGRSRLILFPYIYNKRAWFPAMKMPKITAWHSTTQLNMLYWAGGKDQKSLGWPPYKFRVGGCLERLINFWFCALCTITIIVLLHAVCM